MIKEGLITIDEMEFIDSGTSLESLVNGESYYLDKSGEGFCDVYQISKSDNDKYTIIPLWEVDNELGLYKIKEADKDDYYIETIITLNTELLEEIVDSGYYEFIDNELIADTLYLLLLEEVNALNDSPDISRKTYELKKVMLG